MKETKGTIVKGYGDASDIMSDKIVEYRKKLKSNIVPGTINLKLDIDFIMPENNIAINWGSQNFYYFEIELFNKKAYIMRPERNPFSDDIVEIIAQEHICTKYSLNYGDEVSFLIP